MKLAGAFLALISAAALLWCDSKATKLTGLPPKVTIFCDTFYGDTFVKEHVYSSNAAVEIRLTLEKAQGMLNKFSKYGTAIKLETLAYKSYKDPSFDFNKAVSNSNSQGNAQADMFIYFSHETSSTESVLRKWGLKSRMCDAKRGYRTLLLNSANADRLKLARIIAYYVGTLIGMRNDESTGQRCYAGIMYFTDWHKKDRLRWNPCNAEDFKSFIKKKKNSCIKPLIINCDVFYGLSYATSGVNPSTASIKVRIKNAFKNAENMLNKLSAFGITIKLNMLTLRNYDDAVFGGNGAVAKSRSSGTANANMFIYFAKDSNNNFDILRKSGLKSKMCDTDVAYRTVLLNMARNRFNHIPRILAYYIGRLMGMRSNGPNTCSGDGIMTHASLGKWTNLNWNTCNTNDFMAFYRSSSNTCVEP